MLSTHRFGCKRTLSRCFTSPPLKKNSVKLLILRGNLTPLGLCKDSVTFRPGSSLRGRTRTLAKRTKRKTQTNSATCSVFFFLLILPLLLLLLLLLLILRGPTTDGASLKTFPVRSRSRSTHGDATPSSRMQMTVRSSNRQPIAQVETEARREQTTR